MLPPASQAKTALLCIAILQSRINNKRDHDVTSWSRERAGRNY